MAKSDSISLDDLAIAAEVTTRTIKQWAKQGMPVTQRGRAPSGPGDQAMPWLFPRGAALEWIVDHQRDIRERNRSPYADVLDKRDPRYTRARQRAQKLNDEIEIMLRSFGSRQDAYSASHFLFEQTKTKLFGIPKKLAGKISKLIEGDAQAVEARLREEIATATAGLIAQNTLPSAPSIIPPDMDEDDNFDSDIARLPRLFPGDPRHAVITLLNKREEFRRSIECGDLVELAESENLVSEIYGVAKGLLAAIGGRLAQEFGGSNDAQRQVKKIIDDGIYGVYDSLPTEISDLDSDDSEDEL